MYIPCKQDAAGHRTCGLSEAVGRALQAECSPGVFPGALAHQRSKARIKGGHAERKEHHIGEDKCHALCCHQQDKGNAHEPETKRQHGHLTGLADEPAHYAGLGRSHNKPAYHKHEAHLRRAEVHHPLCMQGECAFEQGQGEITEKRHGEQIRQ